MIGDIDLTNEPGSPLGADEPGLLLDPAGPPLLAAPVVPDVRPPADQDLADEDPGASSRPADAGRLLASLSHDPATHQPLRSMADVVEHCVHLVAELIALTLKDRRQAALLAMLFVALGFGLSLPVLAYRFSG